MTEKLTQLGLIGFGKELPSQVDADLKPESHHQSESHHQPESERSQFVVPLKTVIYRHANPDLGFSVIKPFYVSKKESATASRGLVRVVVEDDEVEVYRDGSRSTLAKGEILEVPIARLIKKKSS